MKVVAALFIVGVLLVTTWALEDRFAPSKFAEVTTGAEGESSWESWGVGEYRYCRSEAPLNKTDNQIALKCSSGPDERVKIVKVRFRGTGSDWSCRKNGDAENAISCWSH